MKETVSFDAAIWDLAKAPEHWNPEEFLDLLDSIVQEALENISEFDKKLITLEECKDDKQLVDSIFRAAHNLKGLAKIMHLQKMTILAKCMENVLDEIRNKIRIPDKRVVDLLLEASDRMKDCVIPAIEAKKPLEGDLTKVLKGFEALYSVAPGVAPPAPAAAPAQPAPPVAAKPAVPQQAAQKPVARQEKKESQILRVRLDKLDTLYNLVGELVIGKSRFDEKLSDLSIINSELQKKRKQLQDAWRDLPDAKKKELSVINDDIGRINLVISEIMGELGLCTENISFLSDRLQENVMKARMVPVSQLFDKFPRMIRDLAGELGKKIDLVIEGEGTEIDKMLADEIADPLMHLIRNSVDHGIEAPEKRVKSGKPDTGFVKIRAYHAASQMVIEIEDDGKGIDPGIIRETAIAKGVLRPEDAAIVPDDQIVNLIFHAGFSTAKKVTEISGRGVGLDVVKDKVMKLKGSVSVSSTPGVGCKFLIRLPLTLAITNVLLVLISNETYAIPISSIKEVLIVPSAEIKPAGTRSSYNLRGETLFVTRLADALNITAESWEDKGETVLVVAGDEDRQVGLAVDATMGKREVVIKSLGTYLKRVRFALGTTILGNGKVVVILDAHAILAAFNLGLLGAFAPQDPKPAHALKPGLPAKDAKARTSILVAEDSPTIRKRLVEILSSEGWDITEAEDGQVALELAMKRRFDLVSTDIMMPHMDGYELTKNLRRLPQYKRVPILMVTSKSEKIDKVRGFDAGADDYITKPVDKAAYINAIKSNLNLA